MNWIDCRERMPEEEEYASSYFHSKARHFKMSKRVLAWDSMYGPHIDWTVDGKWNSEKAGGYQGQACHGVVAWTEIPEMDIEEYKL